MKESYAEADTMAARFLLSASLPLILLLSADAFHVSPFTGRLGNKVMRENEV